MSRIKIKKTTNGAQSAWREQVRATLRRCTEDPWKVARDSTITHSKWYGGAYTLCADRVGAASTWTLYRGGYLAVVVDDVVTTDGCSAVCGCLATIKRFHADDNKPTLEDFQASSDATEGSLGSGMLRGYRPPKNVTWYAGCCDA